MRRHWPPVSLLAALVLGSLIVGSEPVIALQGAPPKILRKPWSTEFIYTLEPQTNEAGISDLTLLNYEGLTRFDEELNVVPGRGRIVGVRSAGTTLPSTFETSSRTAMARR